MHVTDSLNLNKKQFLLLGRLCASQKPELARELLSIYNEKPISQDHSLISAFFLTFCQLQNINPDDYRGSLFKSKKVELRRLFIASMTHIYIPHVHNEPANCMRLHYGFLKQLSQELQQKPQNVGKMIREVITIEKVYEEFRANVKALTLKLTQPYEQAATE